MFIKCFMNQKQCKLENKLCNRKNGGNVNNTSFASSNRERIQAQGCQMQFNVLYILNFTT